MNEIREARFAAIDIGTNSVHLLIARVNSSGGFEVLDHDKDMIRLGASLGPQGELTESAIERTLLSLGNFQRRAKVARAEVRAVATSAVREAPNREVLLARARKELKLNLEVASGNEEARLTYTAVRKAIEPGRKPMLMIDIGGGSTEFVVGREEDIQFDDSLKTGSVRLSQKFFKNGVVDNQAVKDCRKQCILDLQPIRRAQKSLSYELAAGSSGTIQCIGRIVLFARGEQPEGRLNRVVISRDEVAQCADKILSAKTIAARSKIKGVDAGRAEVLPGGAILLETIMQELKLPSLVLSEFSLREGILFDSIARRFRQEQFLSHEGQRYRSVISLAQRFQYESVHAHHVTNLALQIFDSTVKLHGLGPLERELLEAASLLHDLGLFISHSAHHRHSFYIIRNAQLLGFTDWEQMVIAFVARYHRKSPPRKSHLEYQSLLPPQQALVSQLAGMLRIADGLDRTHVSAVKSISVRPSGKKLQFILTPAIAEAIQYSIWGAERKKDLFEEIFQKELEFVIL